MKKRRLLLIPVIVLGIAVYGGYSWWHGQASTSNVVYGKQSDNAVLGSETSLTDWKTLYFDTKFPTNLRHHTTTETPNSPTVGSYLLTSTDPENIDQLAVSIGTLNNNSLQDLSSIQLRLSQPNNYTSTTRSFAPPGAIAFSSTGNYETSVFWQHGADYVAVVVSGSIADKADLEQALSAVVSNWQWL